MKAKKTKKQLKKKKLETLFLDLKDFENKNLSSLCISKDVF